MPSRRAFGKKSATAAPTVRVSDDAGVPAIRQGERPRIGGERSVAPERLDACARYSCHPASCAADGLAFEGISMAKATSQTGTKKPSAPREARVGRFWGELRKSVGHAVVGGEDALRLLAVALLADGHALIEDVPGVGKTLLARSFARSLGLSFNRVQGTPDLLPTDVTGSSLLQEGSLRFVPGPVFTNVLLVDEINRATPRTQSALLEAMQERQVSIEGETRPLPQPFFVVATQNPVELEGTFSLPEAQLDRFLVLIRLGYPSRDEEHHIARRYRDGDDPLDRIRPIVGQTDVAALRAEVNAVAISEVVEGYLVDIVRATRGHVDLRLGGSPRSTVALYRASQAWAALEGRSFVLPDDVMAIARAVLSHRLLLDLDRQLRGATVQTVLEEILARVPVPVPET
jgi:MoxR-like ATPase